MLPVNLHKPSLNPCSTTWRMLTPASRAIAYSKHGIVASISPDGAHVNLQCPCANPEDGSWELNEPIACSILPAPLQGGPIVHLAWAPTTAPELAIIDAFGRVCILAFPVHLNKAAFIRKWDADAQDDLHSVVGCFWLPLVVPRLVGDLCCKFRTGRVLNLMLCSSTWDSDQRYGRMTSIDLRTVSRRLLAPGTPTHPEVPWSASPPAAFSSCFSPRTTIRFRTYS